MAEVATVEVRWIPPRDLVVGPFVAKDRDVVLILTIPGEPASKSRARWGKYGNKPYTPEATRMREEAIGLLAKQARRELSVDPIGLFSVRAAFYLGSNQARDVDNMLKLVMDAVKGVIWEDDRQVVEVFGFKVPADKSTEARTEVVIARLPGAMPYIFERCEVCSRQFRTYPSWRYKRCCSRICWGLSIRKRDTVNCAKCGKAFEVRRYRIVANKNHLCSIECKRAFGGEEVACAECGKVFRIQTSAKARRPNPTCSHHCRAKYGWRVRGGYGSNRRQEKP